MSEVGREPSALQSVRNILQANGIALPSNDRALQRISKKELVVLTSRDEDRE